MKNLLGFSIICLTFLQVVQAGHVVFPFHLGQLDGDRSSTHCNNLYGGLLPYLSITSAIETEIFGDIGSNQRLGSNEEKRQGSCYQATIFRGPHARRCSDVSCQGTGHVVCFRNNTDLSKTTQSERTQTKAQSTILSQTLSMHVHLTEKNDDTIPTTILLTCSAIAMADENSLFSGTALKAKTLSTAFLPRRVVLKYIVIPFISVILIVLIIVILRLLKRKRHGRNEQRNNTPEYYNMTSEDRVPMEGHVSNHINVYAEPDNAHIIPSAWAEYADISDGSADMTKSAQGKAAEASYSNATNGGDSKDDLLYSYATLPIEGTLTRVDVTMTYSNMAATGIDVADSACIGQRANHSRSLAVTDNCYVNTQLK